MIVVLASYRVRPGSWEHVKAHIAPTRATTLTEDGCIAYDFHADLSDEERLVIVERWTSKDALLRHAAAPHVAAWRAATKDHMSGRKVEIVHPERIEPL